MSTRYIQDQPKVHVDENTLAVMTARNAELEAERSQLRMKIILLEHSLVDVIERSNNPLRVEPLSEEKVRLLEEAKREWSAQWNVERSHLMGEIRRLRQLATSILSSDMTATR